MKRANQKLDTVKSTLTQVLVPNYKRGECRAVKNKERKAVL
jgi:hypothetical protein